MKKYLVLVAVLVASSAFGYKRNCMSSSDTSYTYALTILDAPTSAVMCRVYLTSTEKEFIKQVLSKEESTKEVTRSFYIDAIKNKYSGDTDREKALRRVVRDFGGSSKVMGETRKTHTIGDIRAMLAGNLKNIATEQP